jgi:hypothetical protein
MRNKEVTLHDNEKIMEVSNLIILIEVNNIGRDKSVKEDNFSILASKISLYIRVKVLLIEN